MYELVKKDNLHDISRPGNKRLLLPKTNAASDQPVAESSI